MVKKTDLLQVRVTPEEMEAFVKLSAELGLANKSSLLRKLVRESINQEIDLLNDEHSLLMVAIRQLVGIANNLNQLTAAMHQGKMHRTVDKAYLADIKGHVLIVKKALEVCIKKTKNRWIKKQ